MNNEARDDLIVMTVGTVLMIAGIVLAAYLQREASSPMFAANVKRALQPANNVPTRADTADVFERQFWREVSWLEHGLGR